MLKCHAGTLLQSNLLVLQKVETLYDCVLSPEDGIILWQPCGIGECFVHSQMVILASSTVRLGFCWFQILRSVFSLEFGKAYQG